MVGKVEQVHILFVCTGNICRSPSAERLAIAFAEKRGIKDFRASSAGTLAVISHPMHREAAAVLESLGGESGNFAARQLSAKIANDADLILTMTREHRDRVLELAPRKLRQTFTLREASQIIAQFGPADIGQLASLRTHLRANADLDIADPIGQGPDTFAAVGSQIASLLPPVLEAATA